MLANALSNKFAVAFGLRIIELILLFIILSAAGLILSEFSEEYYIQKHASIFQNIETMSLFLISPIYISGALLCSVMTVSDYKTVFGVFIWIGPAIVMFVVHNMFSMGGLLPTSSFLISSVIVITVFKLTIGNVK